MEQRLLGRSGLSVSALSFGTMTIGGRGDRFSKMGTLGVDDTVRILDILRDAGVTTLDTADLYSAGGSEEILGEALKGRRDAFVVVTKAFNRMGPRPHDIGLSRAHLIAACEASLRRLQTDYLDLYLCHHGDALVPIEETLRAYEDLVRSGKVRYIGCSNHSAWRVMKALGTSDRIGTPRYICQQVNYSLVSRDVEHEIIPLALEEGCGLMVWSPLHAGLLTGKFRRDTPRPAVARLNDLDVFDNVDYERVYRIVDVLDAIAKARSVSISQVALNWVLYKPGIDTVIVGARNETQLRDNLAAATWRLTPEESARLDEVSALPEPYPYWHQHRFGIERNPRLPAQRR
jgi:aryl-alcohol dehydrogenase-like predicted oxidoreductase